MVNAGWFTLDNICSPSTKNYDYLLINFYDSGWYTGITGIFSIQKGVASRSSGVNVVQGGDYVTFEVDYKHFDPPRFDIVNQKATIIIKKIIGIKLL